MAVDLRVYLERVVQELDRRVDQRFQSLREEMVKTEGHLRERLHGMNEFREAMKDLSAQMATRDELSRVEDDFARRMEKLSQEIQDLQKYKSFQDGRSMVLSGVVSTFVAILVSAIMWSLSHFF